MKEDPGTAKGRLSEEEIEKIRKYVESVHFGSVTLIIHDGRIVQIEKNEKIKLN